jgi:hypothetical protein
MMRVSIVAWTFRNERFVLRRRANFAAESQSSVAGPVIGAQVGGLSR